MWKVYKKFQRIHQLSSHIRKVHEDLKPLTVLNVVKLLRINGIQNSFQIHSLCYFAITVSPWSRADIETSVHKGEHSYFSCLVEVILYYFNLT